MVKQCEGESSCPFTVPLSWINTITGRCPQGYHCRLIHQCISFNLTIYCDIMGWGNVSNLTINMAVQSF